ncbi:MAG: ferritin-like domain-containing protein [Myxococcota bacterium]
MRLRDIRLQLALTAALAAGTSAACRSQTGSAPEVPVTPDTPATPSIPAVDEASPISGDLKAQCAAPILQGFTPAEPVDFLAIRTSSDMRDPRTEDGATLGTACSGASNKDTCISTLAASVPGSTGYGYCGMGCSDTGLVYTRGDTVGLVDSPQEAAAFFGTIDTVAEVLHLVRTHDHEPNCTTLQATAKAGYQIEATFQTSDCPFTDERRLLSVAADGTLTQLKMLERTVGGGCAGRRPDGLLSNAECLDDPVAEQLGVLAHLEAAAVVAFERLALDLERIGAPAAFAERAREAAEDEVRHAEQMAAQARARGVEPQPVCAGPHDSSRSLLALAIENAVEGCVRETYGVVDALHRAQSAESPALRLLFSEIAKDEARHAELSWDLHRWMMSRLCIADRQTVLTAMADAHSDLRDELEAQASSRVQQVLGAPGPTAAMAMAESLRSRLG